MGFRSSFVSPVQKSFSGEGLLTPWYLSGNVVLVNCIAAYQAKGAASLAASYVNLANPGTYNATPGVAPTWDAADGWILNGSQYLTTGIIPASGHSVIVQFDLSNGGGTICGQYSPGARLDIWPNDEGGVFYGSGNGGSNVPPPLLTGNLCIAGQQGYRNGVADGASTPNWTSTTAYDIYIGCSHRASGPIYFVTGKIKALAIYNVTLSAPQVLAISTAMAAL